MNDPAAVATFVSALTGGTITFWVFAFGVTKIIDFFTALS